MKPVSYQSMPSSVNGGHPNLALDHLLSTTNVLCCEKCGFASADAAVFKKHMIEHMGTRLHCTYCNNVSFSEAELNEHLKQHTSKYPFRCPHCGQFYIRRRCLVNHIDRLHSKKNTQGPAKPGMTKSLLDPVSSALTSAPTSDPSPFRPLVRVTVPTPTLPAGLLRKDEQRSKTLDTNVSNTTSGNTERLPHLNGLIQHNRALTVSLPEEVTIPAGCLVELVEVKTVNGTKELKLRLVSQQENESVIKDTKTSVSQNTAGTKSLLSAPHPPNSVMSMSMGMCTVNRKQGEAKTVNLERPAVVPANISCSPPSLASTEKTGLKRASSEIINLECSAVVPNKVPKRTLSPMREGNGGIRVPQAAAVNHSAASPAAVASRVASRLSSSLHPGSLGASVPQRASDERKNAALQLSQSVPPRRASDTNGVQDASAAVKLEPRENCIRGNGASKAAKVVVCVNQQSTPASKSLSAPVAAVPQGRPPILVSKDNVVNQPFPIQRTINKPSHIKISLKSNHTKPKISPWNREVRCVDAARGNHVSKPESFPVISSVFSLSEQQEECQGPIQPLVMALRGIVMDKKHSSDQKTQDHIKINGTEHTRKAPASERCARTATKNGFLAPEVLLTERATLSVKAEDQDKVVRLPLAPAQHNSSDKEGSDDSKTSGGNKGGHTPASASSACEESKTAPHADKTASHEQVSTTSDPLLETDKTQSDVASKFLTISLKRVQVGVWRKRKKGLKLRISRYKPQASASAIADCTFISLMPLREDQPVQQPGPNQPVVVLNHPKPRAAAHGPGTDTVADVSASEAVPKCQILKMRLSKVMGQKYEVMGCTVGVFP